MSTLLHRYVGRDSPLARLQDHAARLARMQAILADALPAPCAHACRVANLKDDVLVVAARGSAMAVRVKQMLPSLLERYAQAGYALERIKIKVELPKEEAAAPEVEARAMSANARASLENFAATLPEDAPLREAVENLARRGGG
ncbi:MAG: DUF721 domain-containing protein [Azoarcus sp.]|nr:DUF721 domain-containing protein [Azoarcus sp.]